MSIVEFTDVSAANVFHYLLLLWEQQLTNFEQIITYQFMSFADPTCMELINARLM